MEEEPGHRERISGADLAGQVDALRARVERLHKELDLLKASHRRWVHPVESALWQRGLPLIAHGDHSQVFLPANAPEEHVETFYALMRRYSFRLFLRDLIHTPRADGVDHLTRYCAPRTVRRYLNILAELNMVRISRRGAYELLSPRVASFGPTLEWYVWQLFQREFLAPALFNVRLNRTRHGGDYDVIALVNHRLVYVEVKSSPPRGVEMPAVRSFLNRLQDLQPHVAIFLVDTELRMKDKIVSLFVEALGSKGDPQASWPVERLVRELFHIRHGIYLINSRKGIYSNIRTCLRDFFRCRLPAALGRDK
ncbi:hypothetical protein SAMN02746041_02110 [Desulfacinum hydrothermale DSM 13146]|uniref:Uncharacterized protein n=2 Tax=Desulfacinum hydrothermale TaxID=109258 RepID=A0A1W1XLK0_9BACT|nr:hypothetical protein SAMN02746041_02110 [Desulfacinum hydrothermale DSM 13146]